MGRPTETPAQAIDAVLADLGSICRRAAHHTLTEDDFVGMMRRSRERLKRLRLDLASEAEPVIELTDAGRAAAEACAVGQRPEVRELMRRMPALMTARQLADNPAVDRARFYGPFAAIDGGRP